MERWSEIEGFSPYEVSNIGRVRGRNGVMKPVPLKNGYLTVILRKGGKSYCKYIHRLVASAFLPTADKRLQINHRDKNKANNRVDNLEWCTAEYNVSYSLGKPVGQYAADGTLVKRWECARKAERELGYSHGTVDKCASGKYKQTHGFLFKYLEGDR